MCSIVIECSSKEYFSVILQIHAFWYEVLWYLNSLWKQKNFFILVLLCKSVFTLDLRAWHYYTYQLPDFHLCLTRRKSSIILSFPSLAISNSITDYDVDNDNDNNVAQPYLDRCWTISMQVARFEQGDWNHDEC